MRACVSTLVCRAKVFSVPVMNNSDDSASPCCFGFGLHLEQTVKVLQRGRCAFIAVADVGQVHLLGAATEDGLFFRRHHAVTDELLEQRQHKLRLRLTMGLRSSP